MLVFCKLTNKYELNNIKRITNSLNNSEIIIEYQKYKIIIPNIINWDVESSILYMEYCDGKNLEFYLRNYNTHLKGKIILNSLLKYLIKNKIYWCDFAPRNIIIGKDKIYLVDFEKGILNKDTKLVDYLRNHVYEEYCLFLLKEERMPICKNIFFAGKNKEKVLFIKQLPNKRYKKIAELLGYKKIISMQQYLNILKMIIDVETPKCVKKKFIFPAVILDTLIVNNSNLNPIDDYARELIRLYNMKTLNKNVL